MHDALARERVKRDSAFFFPLKAPLLGKKKKKKTKAIHFTHTKIFWDFGS